MNRTYIVQPSAPEYNDVYNNNVYHNNQYYRTNPHYYRTNQRVYVIEERPREPDCTGFICGLLSCFLCMRLF